MDGRYKWWEFAAASAAERGFVHLTLFDENLGVHGGGNRAAEA